MSRDLTFQQGESWLQTAYADFWSFSINVTSPLMIHLPLRNPTELHHYRVTCIVLLSRIKFSSTSSSSLSLAFVICALSARLLQVNRC
jgi:hypothetical protein